MSFQKKQIRNLKRQARIKVSKWHHSLHLQKWSVMKWFGYIFTVLVSSFMIILGAYLVNILQDLPPVDELQTMFVAQSTTITDREGNELYKIHGDENRKYVPLAQISPHLQEAAISFEDKNFYSNPGIDIIGIMRAALGIVLSRGVITSGGGSTITQQLVKNVFLSPEKTYTRKIKEIVLAWRLDKSLSKQKILELYLNKISYGGGIHGVQMAAEKFFGQGAADLSIAQSAILTVLPNAPTYYSPYGKNRYLLTGFFRVKDKKQGFINVNAIVAKGKKQRVKGEQELLDEVKVTLSAVVKMVDLQNPEGLKLADGRILSYVLGKKDHILQRLVADQKISEKQQVQAIISALSLVFKRNVVQIKDPHFVFYVKKLLDQKYTKEVVEKGGLTVRTTLDPTLQSMAQRVLADRTTIDRKKFGANNAALVSVVPQTGEVLAFVGGRDYWNEEIDGQVDIPNSLRQPGSSFKPIVYALAFEKGYAPASIIYDTPTKFGEDEPANYDNLFMGPLSMRRALDNSRNIPAAKTYFLVGRQRAIVDFARRIGIKSLRTDFDYGWPLAIGSGEVKMLDMVQGYATFATMGRLVPINPILSVRDADGNILEQLDIKGEQRGEQVLKPEIAYLISDVLSDKSARPTYWNSYLSVAGQTVAAKTGTSNKRVKDLKIKDQKKWPILPQDVWTIGYSTSLVTSVWVGNNKGEPMSEKASGLDTAGPIWHKFMKGALGIYPAKRFPIPVDVNGKSLLVKQKVVKYSGLLPNDLTPPDSIVEDIFIKGREPQQVDNFYQRVKIDQITGKKASDSCPKERVLTKILENYHSPYSKFVKWEEGVLSWSEEQRKTTMVPNTVVDCVAPSPELRPAVRLIEPQSLIVAGSSFILKLKAYAPAGLNKIEIWLDNALVKVLNTTPLEANIKITRKQSQHQLKIKIIDGNLLSTVKTYKLITKAQSADILPPNIKILSPFTNQNIPANTNLSVNAAVSDPDGGILFVKAYLDDILLTELNAPPFMWQLNLKRYAQGRHTIKIVAQDLAGHSRSVTKLFYIKSEHSLALTKPFLFINPRVNSWVVGEPLSFHIQVKRVVLQTAKRLEVRIRGKYGYGSDTQIFSIPITDQNRNNVNYVYTWTPDINGSFQVVIKVVGLGGADSLSEPKNIIIQ